MKQNNFSCFKGWPYLFSDGFPTTKTSGTDVTVYDCSSSGELLNVTLPDNMDMEYIYDPLGRRIARFTGIPFVQQPDFSGNMLSGEPGRRKDRGNVLN